MSYRFGRLTTAAFAAAVLLTACGEGVDDNNGSSGGGNSSSSGGDSEEAQAAQDQVDQYTQEPTDIPLTTPLDSPPQPGGTFVWMKCDVGQCSIIADGIREATEAIGWNYEEFSYQSADPATLVTALNDALRLNPTAVGLSGLPRAVWESAASAYQAAGVPIVTGYLGGENNVQDPVIGEVGGDIDVAVYGQMIAQWFIADSNAQGKAVLLSVNDFPVLKTFSDSFKQTVEENCEACEVTEVNATIAQVSGGGTVPPIISALQSDPDIGYVITSNMPFISGIQGQLSAAGLEDIKIAGESADVEGLQLLKNGTYSATTGLALNYTGWLMVDMALRSQQGTPIPTGDEISLPKQLLLPDTDFEVTDSYDKPADFRDQFLALWQVQ